MNNFRYSKSLGDIGFNEDEDVQVVDVCTSSEWDFLDVIVCDGATMFDDVVSVSDGVMPLEETATEMSFKECVTKTFNELDQLRFQVPETRVTKVIDKIFPESGETLVREAFFDLMVDRNSNQYRSVTMEWAAISYNEEGDPVNEDRCGMIERYHSGSHRSNFGGISSTNSVAYEMYAYQEFLMTNRNWKQLAAYNWMSLKALLVFAEYDYKRKYRRLLYFCDDIYFQQYINLVSLIYDWKIVFAYPYVELCYKPKMMKGRVEFISEISKFSPRYGVHSRIGIQRGHMTILCDIDMSAILRSLSCKDVLNCLLVSKGFYDAVILYLRKFLEFSGQHFGIRAYLGSFEKFSYYRTCHDGDSIYSETVFGRNHGCDWAREDVGYLQASGEANIQGCDYVPLHLVRGYDVRVDVSYVSMKILEDLMTTLPPEFSRVYDRLPRLVLGHFAIVFSIFRPYNVERDRHLQKFCKYYGDDVEFYMLLPYMPGAYNWPHQSTAEIGRWGL